VAGLVRGHGMSEPVDECEGVVVDGHHAFGAEFARRHLQPRVEVGVGQRPGTGLVPPHDHFPDRCGRTMVMSADGHKGIRATPP